MIRLYLGKPDYNIEKWIKEHTSEDPTPSLNDPLCFTGTNGSHIKFNGPSDSYGQYGESDFEYLYEDNMLTSTFSWQNYNLGDTINFGNDGAKVYFRAKSSVETLNSMGYDYYRFDGDGSIEASGNIQTLLDKNGERQDVPGHCFEKLFMNFKALNSAPRLPAISLGEYSYCHMFSNSGIYNAPDLPAIYLVNSCYAMMFDCCPSITSVNMKKSIKDNYDSDYYGHLNYDDSITINFIL